MQAKESPYSILCFACVTNRMVQHEGDFENGVANSSENALTILHQFARLLYAHLTSRPAT
ncbi:MAG TPA: hypothetical protein VFN35_26470 [Ktedonobacteraceae bacterium]|nr:hypothetical protein [Ktedonobacteraceae bacterium]